MVYFMYSILFKIQVLFLEIFKTVADAPRPWPAAVILRTRRKYRSLDTGGKLPC